MRPLNDSVQVRVDQQRQAGIFPATKFDLMNSGIVPASAYVRDSAHLRALRASSLRIDVGWGAPWMGHEKEVMNGGPSGFDFSEVDAIAVALRNAGVAPYWSYCYVPEPFTAVGRSWRSMEEDVSGWVSMVANYVAEQTRRGVDVGYHEIYNEPDLVDEISGEKVFFDGDVQDYIELYRQTSRAIRNASPRALIGGPSLSTAFANLDWLEAFLDAVIEEELPLDFVSIHHYGWWTLLPALERVIQTLDVRPTLAAVDIHLNEYNSFPINYPSGGPQEGLAQAAAMLADFERLLSVPRVTKVHWAQFQDSGYGLFCGLVDIHGRRKPPYWAMRWFRELGPTRLAVEVCGPRGVGALAGSNAEGTQILIWNRAGRPLSVSVQLSDATGHATLERLLARWSEKLPVAMSSISVVDGWVVVHMAANEVVRISTPVRDTAIGIGAG